MNLATPHRIRTALSELGIPLPVGDFNPQPQEAHSKRQFVLQIAMGAGLTNVYYAGRISLGDQSVTTEKLCKAKLYDTEGEAVLAARRVPQPMLGEWRVVPYLVSFHAVREL